MTDRCEEINDLAVSHKKRKRNGSSFYLAASKFWNIVKRPGNRLESRFWSFSNVSNEKLMVVGVWCMKKVFSKRGSKRLNHFSNIVISTDYEKIQKKTKETFACANIYTYMYIYPYIFYIVMD